MLRDQRKVKIVCDAGVSEDHVLVEMLWNKTWDAEMFNSFLERLKSKGWISRNRYKLDGVIYIDMTDFESSATVKGTAKLIEHTLEEFFPSE